MNTPILANAILVVATASTIAEDSDRTLGLKIAGAAALLEQAEGHRREFRELLRLSEEGKHLSPEQTARFLTLSKEAHAAYSQAKEIVGMLKPGDSVFQYPGLLAMGEVRYQPEREEYRLRIRTGVDEFFDIEFRSTCSISRLKRHAPIR